MNSRDYHPLDSSKDPFCKFLREAVALNRSIERSKLRCCQKTDVCARNYIYISRRRSGKKDLKDHLMEESVCYCTNSIFDNFKVVDGISTQLYRAHWGKNPYFIQKSHFEKLNFRQNSHS